MKRTFVASMLLITLAAGGCAGLTETQQRTVTGGAGGAAGAGGGFLYGRGVEEGQRRR